MAVALMKNGSFFKWKQGDDQVRIGQVEPVESGIKPDAM